MIINLRRKGESGVRDRKGEDRIREIKDDVEQPDKHCNGRAEEDKQGGVLVVEDLVLFLQMLLLSREVQCEWVQVLK